MPKVCSMRMSEKKAPTTKIPLTRADIIAIRDTADSLVRYDNGQASDPRVRARWPIDASALQVRDLAATALELDRKLGEVTDDWQHCCADNANAGGSIDDLRARLRTAEARIAALEEGLREAVAEAHGHGLVRDHPDLFDYCPDRMCAEARALLTERDDLGKGVTSE